MAKRKNTGNSLNTSEGNVFNKGMAKDYTEIFLEEGLWTHAVNAINNAHYGETGSIGNEPSNEFCASAPYDIIGYTHKSGTEWVIFSTNNTDSEIGIFDQASCEYRVVINDPCLSFSKTHIIKAVAKENYDCTYSAYWQDNLNPDRTLNLDDVPYICEPVSEDPCDGEICTDRLDCNAIRLHPLVKQPCLDLQRARGNGQLPNGSYMAVLAYSENGVRLTDYSMPSQAQSLWVHEGTGLGLELEVSNLDQNYDEYEIGIIGFVAQQLLIKKLGNYSTDQTKIYIDLVPLSNETISAKEVPLRNVVYERSAGMFAVNDYLIRTGVTSQPKFNYQPLANQILSNWVAVEYPKDYYWNGGNILGYFRDEVYTFFIRWVYATGARSDSYHIPGRAAIPTDTAPVSTSDVVYPNETELWQVYDTSTYNAASGVEKDGGVIVAKGKMAYWESVERYPVNTTIWGDLCNEPIRHHKMPSNETVHIHTASGERIVVLGAEFTNIQHPVDNNGNPIQDIVGYEILRGTREGNRSIVAKGLINNMFEFPLEGTNFQSGLTPTKGLFPNYPWNDLRPDPFLTGDYDVLDNNVNDYDNPDDPPRLSTYRRDYFSFHSPETSFLGPQLSAGNYLKVYTEERGKAIGKFDFPYQHPKFKLITDFSFIAAFGLGVLIAFIDSVGKTTIGPGGNTYGASIPAALLFVNNSQRISGEGSAIGDLAGAFVTKGIAAQMQIADAIGIAVGITSFILSAALFVGRAVDALLTIIRNLSKWRDYYLQYNGVGEYNRWAAITNSEAPAGKKCFRRLINTGKYIGSHVQDFDADFRINNLYRTKTACLNTEGLIPNPQGLDNSKKRVADIVSSTDNTYKKPTIFEFQSRICSYYAAIKRDIENQYGQIPDITQMPTDSCIYYTEPQVGLTFSTNTIFGGDIYINRYTEKNPYFFFNTWLVDYPNGTELDYTLNVNGPAPRYYARLQEFDFSDFGIVTGNSGSTDEPEATLDFNTPSDLYRFDESTTDNSGIWIKRHCWAYLFYNGVKDFFTESELNMAYRDYGEINESQKFFDVYGFSFNDIYTMFRSDIIQNPSYFKYDLSLTASRLPVNLSKWGNVLPRDYDPELYETCFEYWPKRAVYSLQAVSGQKRDNWRNYLPLNYKDFGGKINTIKSLNATGALILFDEHEPLMFTGVDQLQVKGQDSTKLTIGDAGLFQNNFQAFVNADDALNYGACISSRSAINTPYGLFYISQNQGKIFGMAGSSLDEISRNGMKFWFAEYLPSQLLEVYPEYPLYDNPVAGIGCQAIFDPTYELLYFTKKDYKPLRDDLVFDDPKGVPYYICGFNNPSTDEVTVPEPTGDPDNVQCTLSANLVNVSYGQNVVLTWTTSNATSVQMNNGVGSVGLNGAITINATSNTTYYIQAFNGDDSSVCSIDIRVDGIPIKCPCPYEDPACFEPCDWTVSYDPKTKLWLSFHDWHPNLLMPSYKHFYTIKNDGIWEHNDRWDSYCNYYGVDYPWEIEYPVVTPNSITTLRSLEYTLDVYKFYNNGNDHFHILDENFDRAIVYNSEQISGLLRLSIKGKNSPLDLIQKPTFNGTSIDIFYSKEENKYRFNQFWDITNDRGEFTGTQLPMWNTACSGYKKEINPAYVDYNKSELQHKKFRHYGNSIILRKNISNDKKMVLKLVNNKQNLSPR